MRRLLNRLRTLWAARDADADLRAEIEAHRALHEDALRRSGVPAGEAAQQSRRRAWATSRWPARRREACACRNGSRRRGRIRRMRGAPIRRAPGFSAAVIGVMALGLSATTAVFGLVDRLVLADLPVRRAGPAGVAEGSRRSPIRSSASCGRGADASSTGFFAWNTDPPNVEWTGEPEPGDRPDGDRRLLPDARYRRRRRGGRSTTGRSRGRRS